MLSAVIMSFMVYRPGGLPLRKRAAWSAPSAKTCRECGEPIPEPRRQAGPLVGEAQPAQQHGGAALGRLTHDEAEAVAGAVLNAVRKNRPYVIMPFFMVQAMRLLNRVRLDGWRAVRLFLALLCRWFTVSPLENIIPFRGQVGNDIMCVMPFAQTVDPEYSGFYLVCPTGDRRCILCKHRFATRFSCVR